MRGRMVAGPWMPILLSVLAFFPSTAEAARISEVMQVDLAGQLVRFFSFADPAVRHIVMGSVLMGINFGLLGSFVVVRRMALVGDTLSHAVLPGVAMGFLVTMSKEPWAILLGATVAGLLGTAFVSWIQHRTKLKQDAALGMVLATFFALGVCLIKMIERVPGVNKSGLDHFFYGQAAALGSKDLWMMGITTAVSLAVVWRLYRPLLACSFDPVFSESIDYPVKGLYYVLMLMLALATVVALQAVGALMVSAMLITPAATAYLLCKRLHRMLWVACAIGVAASLLGAFMSFVGEGVIRHALPTGPSMALCAGSFFLTAFCFSPGRGLVFRWWSRLRQTRRIHVENTLKAIYRVLEMHGFAREGVHMTEMLAEGRFSEAVFRRHLQWLVRDGSATLSGEDRALVSLTPKGFQEASRVVRNHRLWELYLTSNADFEPDHVHDDAEKVEHILKEQMVLQLEKDLDYPAEDPHGKRIPSLRDTQAMMSSQQLGNEPKGEP